jgi:hypothetical protein
LELKEEKEADSQPSPNYKIQDDDDDLLLMREESRKPMVVATVTRPDDAA